MAAVFSEIEIELKGVIYHVTPTMRLINRIEQDVSLAKLAYRVASGDAPFSHVAMVLGHILRADGCRETDEDILEALLSNEGGQDLRASVDDVLTACFPRTESTEDLKKSQAAK